MELVIRQATISDVDELVPLFDGYRRFYGYASEPDRTRRFLKDRFENNQSVIFRCPAWRSGSRIHAALPQLLIWSLGPNLYLERSLRRSYCTQQWRRDWTSKRCLGVRAACWSTPLSAIHAGDECGCAVAIREAGMEKKYGVL